MPKYIRFSASENAEMLEIISTRAALERVKFLPATPGTTVTFLYFLDSNATAIRSSQKPSVTQFHHSFVLWSPFDSPLY